MFMKKVEMLSFVRGAERVAERERERERENRAAGRAHHPSVSSRLVVCGRGNDSAKCMPILVMKFAVNKSMHSRPTRWCKGLPKIIVKTDSEPTLLKHECAATVG